MFRVLSAIAAVVVSASLAQATWKPEYAQASPEVQAWYRNAKITERAQHRFTWKNCCDHADVVRTKFRVSHESGADEWWWLDGETWRRVPDDIIHFGEAAPDGSATLFVYKGEPTCFYPPEGGN